MSSCLRQVIAYQALQEISSQWVRELAQIVRGLSFSNIFGDKLRIAIPFQSIALQRIKSTIEDADSTTEVDPEAGTVIKTTQPRQGPPRQRIVRLGRTIQKSLQGATKRFVAKLGEYGIEATLDGKIKEGGSRSRPSDEVSVADYFSFGKALLRGTFGSSFGWTSSIKDLYYIANYIVRNALTLEPDEEDMLKATASTYLELIKMQKNYAEEAGGSMIIISRAPIDVLRMSDFKSLESCHSEGGSYFQCAVAEAKDGGLVTYLVKKEDIKKVDLNAEEIFEDKDREIQGIRPISRLRLRQFQHKSGFNLAVPEIRDYGSQREGFIDTITEWASETQLDDMSEAGLDPETLDMKEFKLMGGSYYDNPASALFNNMFGTNRFQGNVSYGGQEEDSDDIVREEAQDYYVQHAPYSPIDIDWDVEDGEVVWSWVYNKVFTWTTSGYGDFVQSEPKLAYDKAYNVGVFESIRHAIECIANDHGIMTKLDVDVDVSLEEVEVTVEASVDSSGHPDDFNDDLKELQAFNVFLTYYSGGSMNPIEKAIDETMDSFIDNILVDD